MGSRDIYVRFYLLRNIGDLTDTDMMKKTSLPAGFFCQKVGACHID